VGAILREDLAGGYAVAVDPISQREEITGGHDECVVRVFRVWSGPAAIHGTISDLGARHGHRDVRRTVEGDDAAEDFRQESLARPEVLGRNGHVVEVGRADSRWLTDWILDLRVYKAREGRGEVAARPCSD